MNKIVNPLVKENLTDIFHGLKRAESQLDKVFSQNDRALSHDAVGKLAVNLLTEIQTAKELTNEIRTEISLIEQYYDSLV